MNQVFIQMCLLLLEIQNLSEYVDSTTMPQLSAFSVFRMARLLGTVFWDFTYVGHSSL
jgi:hypothetical protein